MCNFKVYQANKNIRGTCVNIPLRKDNKIFAKEVVANSKIRMKHTQWFIQLWEYIFINLQTLELVKIRN